MTTTEDPPLPLLHWPCCDQLGKQVGEILAVDYAQHLPTVTDPVAVKHRIDTGGRSSSHPVQHLRGIVAHARVADADSAANAAAGRGARCLPVARVVAPAENSDTATSARRSNGFL